MYLWIALLFELKILANAQTWSTWTSCSYPETCQNKTELICDNGRGIQCSQYGTSPYQITLLRGCNGNCDGFDDSKWEGSYISLSCRGSCYDSMLMEESRCKTIQDCKRHRYHRCYNEQTCRGIWKETSSQCSSSCGGGTRSVIKTCINQTTGQESNNCIGTFYGTDNQFNISQPCNTHACPTSTPEESSHVNVAVGIGFSILILNVVTIVFVIVSLKTTTARNEPKKKNSNEMDNFTAQSKTKSNETEDSKYVDCVNVDSSKEYEDMENNAVSKNASSSENRTKAVPQNKEAKTSKQKQTKLSKEQLYDSIYEQPMHEYENQIQTRQSEEHPYDSLYEQMNLNENQMQTQQLEEHLYDLPCEQSMHEYENQIQTRQSEEHHYDSTYEKIKSVNVHQKEK